MILAIGTEGRRSRADFDLRAVVVVDTLALQDEVCLAVSLVLMVAKRRAGLDRDACEGRAFVAHLLLAEQVLKADFAFAARSVLADFDVSLQNCHVVLPFSPFYSTSLYLLLLFADSCRNPLFQEREIVR